MSKTFRVTLDEATHAALEGLAEADMRLLSAEAAWLLSNAIKTRINGEAESVVNGAVMDLAAAIRLAGSLKDAETKVNSILVEAGIRQPPSEER